MPVPSKTSADFATYTYEVNEEFILYTHLTTPLRIWGTKEVGGSLDHMQLRRLIKLKSK